MTTLGRLNLKGNSQFIWELTGFLFLPISLDYLDLRQRMGVLWWFFYLLFLFIFLFSLHFNNFVVLESIKKSIFGSIFCIIGYWLFSIFGIYNIFNPLDFPILIVPPIYFMFKYSLLHLFFRHQEIYKPYMSFNRLLQEMGTGHFIPLIPKNSDFLRLPLYFVGILDLSGLEILSLPPNWLEKVPPSIRIIDLTENNLQKTFLSEEDASKFMERWPNEYDIVLVNFLGNPIEERLLEPDWFHPRLFILSEPDHTEMALRKIGRMFPFTLSDKYQRIIEEDKEEIWDELFEEIDNPNGLEKESKIGLVWAKCIHVLTIEDTEKRWKNLLSAGMALKNAYYFFNDENEEFDVS